MNIVLIIAIVCAYIVIAWLSFCLVYVLYNDDLGSKGIEKSWWNKYAVVFGVFWPVCWIIAIIVAIKNAIKKRV